MILGLLFWWGLLAWVAVEGGKELNWQSGMLFAFLALAPVIFA